MFSNQLCKAPHGRNFIRPIFWGSGFGRTDFWRMFFFWAAGFSRGFSRWTFSPHFCGRKCPEKSSRKILLQNLYSKNPPTHFCRLAGQSGGGGWGCMKFSPVRPSWSPILRSTLKVPQIQANPLAMPESDSRRLRSHRICAQTLVGIGEGGQIHRVVNGFR